MRFAGGHVGSYRINLALRFDDRKTFTDRVAIYAELRH